MRISDWSSDVCSSDLRGARYNRRGRRCRRAQLTIVDRQLGRENRRAAIVDIDGEDIARRLSDPYVGINSGDRDGVRHEEAVHFRSRGNRSEEHTSELQSLMSISNAVFCWKKKEQTMYAGYADHLYA